MKMLKKKVFKFHYRNSLTLSIRGLGSQLVSPASNLKASRPVMLLSALNLAVYQFLALAWPNSKCAVMGANQATGVLTTIEEASRKRKGGNLLRNASLGQHKTKRSLPRFSNLHLACSASKFTLPPTRTRNFIPFRCIHDHSR